MKQYVTHGTGSAQTLSEVQNTNVVVYDTKADAEADLSNLSEGQIVATKDSGDELAQPVNEVTLNNLHSVTSNATFKACSPNYAQAQLIYGGTDDYSDNFTVPENGILIGSGYGSNSANSFIYFSYYGGGVTARQQGVGSENISVFMPVRKGDIINVWCYLASNNQGVYFVPYN